MPHRKSSVPGLIYVISSFRSVGGSLPVALLPVFRYVNALRTAVYTPHPHLRGRHLYTITCAVTDNDQATATQTATIKVTSQASVAAKIND